MATYARFEKNGQNYYGQVDGDSLNILSDSPLGSFPKVSATLRLYSLAFIKLFSGRISSAGQPLLPTEIESLAWTDYLCVCGSVRLRLGKNPNS